MCGPPHEVLPALEEGYYRIWWDRAACARGEASIIVQPRDGVDRPLAPERRFYRIKDNGKSTWDTNLNPSSPWAWGESPGPLLVFDRRVEDVEVPQK